MTRSRTTRHCQGPCVRWERIDGSFVRVRFEAAEFDLQKPIKLAMFIANRARAHNHKERFGIGGILDALGELAQRPSGEVADSLPVEEWCAPDKEV